MKPQGEGSPPSQSEPAPKTLEELADQIHRRFIRFEDVRAPDQVETEAARAFAPYYQKYLGLGGKPFQTTKNWLLDLVTLEQRCRGKVTSQLDGSTQRHMEGEWSQPMSKGKIKAALGLDSYCQLDKLSKEGVYRIRQHAKSRQRWMIRLDTVDSETRQKFRTT
jgi:hypothetical protein